MVLDAAWALLEEHGVEKLTMAEVARRAGVSRRAIYLHFSSRTDLLFALHGRVNEVLGVRESVQSIYEAPDSVAALDAWVAHTVRVHTKLIRLVQAVDQARRTDPDAAGLWTRAMDGWLRGCRAVTASLAREGRLAEPWTVEVAADLLWALMSVDLIEDLVEDRCWSEQLYRDRFATLVHRTLVKPRSGRGCAQSLSER
jgi:AcrR family transcriptional regulator